MKSIPPTVGRAPPRSDFVLGALASLAFALTTATAHAAPVGDALDRPALKARGIEHAVLLGAAAAGNRIVVVGERGIIALSDDGGRSWRQAECPVSVTLTAVRFANGQIGYAVGHAGVVLATRDGGETWTRRLDGRRIAQLVLDAAKARSDATAIQNAQRFVADGADKPLLDVLLLDTRRVLAVGAYGLAILSEDEGKTWTPWSDRLHNPKGLHLYAVRRLGERFVIAGEQGLLLKSEDGGKTFHHLATPYKGSFFTAELTSESEIVVAGLRGNVWRSTDDGASWTRLDSPMPASVTGSELRADRSLLFVNQAGFVLSRHDGALVPANGAPLPPLNSVLTMPDGRLLTLGVQGVTVLPRARATASKEDSK